jgi:hypothetical protein
MRADIMFAFAATDLDRKSFGRPAQDVSGRIKPHPCELSPDLVVFMDQQTASPRITYAQIEKGVVQAIMLFIFQDRLDGVPCFELGDAVAEGFRGRGIAPVILPKCIAEMRRNRHRSSTPA